MLYLEGWNDHYVNLHTQVFLNDDNFCKMTTPGISNVLAGLFYALLQYDYGFFQSFFQSLDTGIRKVLLTRSTIYFSLRDIFLHSLQCFGIRHFLYIFECEWT